MKPEDFDYQVIQDNAMVEEKFGDGQEVDEISDGSMD
jgi:hypothetical protein